MAMMMIRWAVLKKPRSEQKGGMNPKLLNVHTYAHAKGLKPGRKGDTAVSTGGRASRFADREAGDLGAHGCGLGAGQADVGANVPPEELAAAPLESESHPRRSKLPSVRAYV